MQTDTSHLLQNLCPPRLLWQEKDPALSVWTSARQQQVYLLIYWLIKSDCDCRNTLIFPNISITSDYYMHDGRCRLINRGNLLVRLMEWQAQGREKMDSQIVGENNERGKERGKKRWWGEGRFIIGALNVLSSCYEGLESLMEKWFHSHRIRPKQWTLTVCFLRI